VNSGNANCATGRSGIRTCQQVCRDLARLLELRAIEVFPSSTGIIGVPLPVKKIAAKLPDLVAARQATKQGVTDFSRAIMTTDTRPKLACATFISGKTVVNILGIAKGAGMIHPQLATMLVYLFTDVAANSTELKHALKGSCEETFNHISIDGDTSTNDTVLLLASGKSGVALNKAGVKKRFSAGLLRVCQSLADQIVSDGEGVVHVIHLIVE
jgi:glutamate N-acetyltransferase / amino-acid N-acetyltransferase